MKVEKGELYETVNDKGVFSYIYILEPYDDNSEINESQGLFITIHPSLKRFLLGERILKFLIPFLHDNCKIVEDNEIIEKARKLITTHKL